MKKILLLPIGLLPEKTINVLEKNILNQFTAEVSTGESIDLPQHTFDSSRNQYKVDEILIWIKNNFESTNYDKILGISDVDAYSPNRSFIFGKAESYGGMVAMIFLARLKEEFYSKSSNEKKFLERVAKVGVHELGHTFGLEHCRQPSCLMQYSNSLPETDSKGSQMCGICNTIIKRTLESHYS
jgi:archaemetzincin